MELIQFISAWWFILAATIGGITPPVGRPAFRRLQHRPISLGEASRAIWPFVVALVLVTAILTVFPQLTLIAPALFYD